MQTSLENNQAIQSSPHRELPRTVELLKPVKPGPNPKSADLFWDSSGAMHDRQMAKVIKKTEKISSSPKVLHSQHCQLIDREADTVRIVLVITGRHCRINASQIAVRVRL